MNQLDQLKEAPRFPMTRRAALLLFPLLLAGAWLALLFWALSPGIPSALAATDPLSLIWSSSEIVPALGVAWGDVDGDGDLDLAVGQAGHVQLYRNDNGVLTTNAVWSSTELAVTQSVAWGDVDGDGDLDLAVGNGSQDGEPNRMYRNDEGTLTASAVWTSTEADNTSSVAWGDVDGDGDLDLAVGNGSATGQPNRLYRNDNGELTTSAVWSSTDPVFTFSVAWGDVDGDGDLDLAAGNANGPNRLYRNDNGELTTSAVWSSAEPGLSTSVAWGDVDGDGDLDLAVGNNSQVFQPYPLRLYRNDNGVLTGNAVWSSAETDHTLSVAWGDADGDGDLDLIAGNDDQPIRLYRNHNGALTGSAVWSSSLTDATREVAWGDIDGDSDLDLVVGNANQPVRVYGNNNGVLTSRSTAWSPTETNDTHSVAWGDVDGDGDLDLVAGNDDYPVRLYRNDDGRLTSSAAWSAADANATRSLAWGDVDGDGDLDLAVGRGAWPNLLYRNEDGVLTGSAVWSSAESDYTTSVAWGDVDGDGDLDLAVGNVNQPIRWYQNDAGSLTSSAAWSSVETDPTWSVAWGDVDGDGDLDLAVGNNCYQDVTCRSVRLYHNDGGALTSSAVWSSAESDQTFSVAWGDVDGDGDLDLAVGNANQPNRLYRNDNGTLTPSAIWTSIETDPTASVAWGDADGDGDLDLLVGNDRQPLRLYRNDGGALTTSAAWSSPEAAPTMSVAWGDVDRDGDLDLAVGNEYLGVGNDPRLRLYLNGAAGAARLPNNAPSVSLTWLDPLVNANFVYTNPASRTPLIPIPYRLFDPEGDPARSIRASYSLNGGDNWLPAVATTDTVTTNLSTTNLFTHTVAVTSSAGIPDPGTLTSTLALTPTGFIADLDVWLNVTHPVDSDLIITLTAPFGQSVLLVNGRGGSGADFAETIFDDEAPTTIISGTAPFTGRFRPEQALSRLDKNPLAGAWTLSVSDSFAGNSGALLSWGMTATLNSGAVHTYTWDTFASGFFGQSDNVVFRIEAYPVPFSTTVGITDTYRYANTVPDTIQRPFASAVTFPFRARGTQVRVMSDTVPAANALVYRLPAGLPVGGALMSNSAGNTFHTDAQGYLQGRGQINVGDELLALAPITYTDSYTLYYTNGLPNLVGLDAYTVTASGVQTLTVLSTHPLILFNLDLALEWDASQDPTYRQQLEFDLKRASQSLYDFTNGQAALGHVTVHQNADDWVFSHVVIHATNHLRPFAAQGGVVITTTLDPQHPDIVYDIGQVHMGATWNRYGSPGQSLGEDWPLILAHELSHYLFFLDDTYLGLNPDGLLIAVGSCGGSAMGDTYVPDNTEFIGDDAQWNANCAYTLSNQTLGRNEWETIQLWYPALQPPGVANPGPSLMPFNFTTVEIQSPITPTAALADPTFYLDYANGEVSSSQARAFLLRDDKYVIDVGSPVGGQNRLLARGAQPGDRLCVFDRPRYQYGCEIVALGDERLALEHDATWTPVIQITPVTTQTFDIRMESLPGGLPVRARLYPEFGPGEAPITLTEASGVYTGTFNLSYPALAGNVQAWVEEAATETNPRREAMLAYTVGGNPGNQRSGIADTRAGGGNQRSGIGNQRSGIGSARSGGAPLVSPDGQMIFFTSNPIIFDEGDFYTVQDMAGLPPLPPGKIAIGPGHNLVATPSAPVLTGTVSFQYLGNDVLLEGADEAELTIHFWDGDGWRALPTVRDPYFNLASAHSQGPGVYALLAGVTLPTITSITPASATNELTRTVVISGGYFLAPVQTALLGPTTTYTLPLASVSPLSITAVITQGLPAREYQVWVVNGDGGVSPTSSTFALYDPAQACFYDFFESGASQWQLEGEWSIATLPSGEQAMTDSPAGNYASAIAPALARTTSITSQPFSLAGCANPALTFRHDYVLAKVGASQDVGRVEITTDNGATWTPLASYTGGGIYGPGLQAAPGAEWAAANWKSVVISLSAYTGTVRLRFSLTVDREVSDKGWVIDDVVVQSGPPTHYLYFPLVMRNASLTSLVITRILPAPRPRPRGRPARTRAWSTCE